MASPINLPQAATPFIDQTTLAPEPIWYRLLVKIITRLGSNSGLVQVPNYTVATVPMPSPASAGSMIYLTDTSRPAWSSGAAWLYSDGTPI